jgi:hypothetical protein
MQEATLVHEDWLARLIKGSTPCGTAAGVPVLVQERQWPEATSTTPRTANAWHFFNRRLFLERQPARIDIAGSEAQ